MKIKLFLLVCLATWLLAGCSSPHGTESSRLAAVSIAGKTPAQIAFVTRDVFEANGFKGKLTDPNHFVFERPGTSADTMLYGDWSLSPVWIRAKVYLQQIDSSKTLLECDAYRIADHGDPRFEEEHKLTRMRTSFQKMLDEIRTRSEKLHE
jgi:hypothetical protein